MTSVGYQDLFILSKLRTFQDVDYLKFELSARSRSQIKLRLAMHCSVLGVLPAINNLRRYLPAIFFSFSRNFVPGLTFGAIPIEAWLR